MADYFVVEARFYFFTESATDDWECDKNCLLIGEGLNYGFTKAKKLLSTKVGEVRMFAAILDPHKIHLNFHYNDNNEETVYHLDIKKDDLIFTKKIIKMVKHDLFWDVYTDDGKVYHALLG